MAFDIEDSSTACGRDCARTVREPTRNHAGQGGEGRRHGLVHVVAMMCAVSMLSMFVVAAPPKPAPGTSPGLRSSNVSLDTPEATLKLYCAAIQACDVDGLVELYEFSDETGKANAQAMARYNIAQQRCWTAVREKFKIKDGPEVPPPDKIHIVHTMVFDRGGKLITCDNPIGGMFNLLVGTKQPCRIPAVESKNAAWAQRVAAQYDEIRAVVTAGEIHDAYDARQLIRKAESTPLDAVVPPPASRPATTPRPVSPARQLELTSASLVCRGHTDRVWSVAFSPEGKWLASGSGDKSIRIWDSATGRQTAILNGHTGAISRVAVSADGKRLASAGEDRVIRLWDSRTGENTATLKGHQAFVFALAFSRDGRRLASGSNDNTVKIWDSGSGAELETLRGHRALVHCVAFSPDGKRLASSSWDHTVKVWDLDSGKELTNFREHLGVVTSVAFSPDGKLVASTGDDATVRVWDSSSGKVLHSLAGHRGTVIHAVFSPDGKYLASASGNPASIRLWNPVTGQELLVIAGGAEFFRELAFSPDGKRLAAASDDKLVRVWELPFGK